MSTTRLGVTGVANQLQSRGSLRASDWAEVLAGVPLFAGLSKRNLRRIARLATPVRHRRHTRIVREGDAGDAFYVLIDGEASVVGGRRRVRLHPGDFFGEMALLDGAPRSATIEADTEVLAMRIGRRQFCDMLEDEPRIALAVLRELATRIRQMQSRPAW
jgi:CRP/FNR family transcriptional regulator, cyclic AMP receptor protein